MESKDIAFYQDLSKKFVGDQIDVAIKLGNAGVVNTESLNLAAQWRQAQMLAEIAFQLAVMNEREVERATRCGGSVGSQGGTYLGRCILRHGHQGVHSL